jgi:SOS-response transcriptional repressor LexA
MLTKQQARALKLIDTSTERAGFGPSYDEIRRGLGLKSKAGVHRLVHGLVERGFLEAPKTEAGTGRHRGLRVIRTDEEHCRHCGGTGWAAAKRRRGAKP